MKNISDIKHAFYINLDSRPDRKEHVESQLAAIGINAERFKAIKLTNGALGCSMSHLKIMETAKENNWDHILIVEDDIKFLNPDLFVNQFNKFLETHELESSFDVALIAGNNMPPFTEIDDTCVKVTRCQTTTGYLVRNHYFDTMIHNYRKGIEKLMKNPDEHKFYALDKYWFHIQEKHNWYLIIPLTVVQRPDYSDIEKRPTDYTRSMKDLDKIEFMKAQKLAYLKNQGKPSMNLFSL
jgi:glycosyl transferase family 25